MAVRVFCDSPGQLLTEIKTTIRAGKIETWAVDNDGDFTHTPPQWRSQAWLRPKVSTDRLVFNVLTPRGTQMSREVYAIYHGRFIEMLLAHFDLKFERASATALPVGGDIVDDST